MNMQSNYRPARQKQAGYFRPARRLNNCISGIVGGVLADDAAMNKLPVVTFFPMSRSLDIDTQIVLSVPSRAEMGKTVLKPKAAPIMKRAGFLEAAANAPSRCVVIDANRTPDAIAWIYGGGSPASLTAA